MELSLFTAPVDLSGWSLVTAAGVLRLPTGTLLLPQQPLVVTRSAAQFRQQFGPYANLIELPGLTLTEKDRVELKDGPELVDRAAWGGALPGWSLSGRRTLCRNPASQDTSTYLDWTLPSAPSPGAPGCGR